MLDGIKITIEEWAGDNELAISQDQIEELAYAIDTAYEMSLPCGYGVGQLQTKERTELQKLKDQISLLERFIQSKGHSIILYEDKITELVHVRCGSSHFTISEKDFK